MLEQVLKDHLGEEMGKNLHTLCFGGTDQAKELLLSLVEDKEALIADIKETLDANQYDKLVAADLLLGLMEDDDECISEVVLKASRIAFGRPELAEWMLKLVEAKGQWSLDGDMAENSLGIRVNAKSPSIIPEIYNAVDATWGVQSYTLGLALTKTWRSQLQGKLFKEAMALIGMTTPARSPLEADSIAYQLGVWRERNAGIMSQREDVATWLLLQHMSHA